MRCASSFIFFDCLEKESHDLPEFFFSFSFRWKSFRCHFFVVDVCSMFVLRTTNDLILIWIIFYLSTNNTFMFDKFISSFCVPFFLGLVVRLSVFGLKILWMTTIKLIASFTWNSMLLMLLAHLRSISRLFNAKKSFIFDLKQHCTWIVFAQFFFRIKSKITNNSYNKICIALFKLSAFNEIIHFVQCLITLLFQIANKKRKTYFVVQPFDIKVESFTLIWGLNKISKIKSRGVNALENLEDLKPFIDHNFYSFIVLMGFRLKRQRMQ